MKVLITGALGFVGKNLVEFLKTKEEIELLLYDKDNSIEDLDEFCKNCDFVVNLAGVNRTNNSDDFIKGNLGVIENVVEFLVKHNNNSPIIYSSSIQALLDNDYGKSKRVAEDFLIKYSQEKNVPVYIFRFTNLFGKWSLPNYNTVIATFCYNIARNLEIRIDDENKQLNLTYIDDVVSEIYNIIMNKPIMNDCFCEVSKVYTKNLGEIAKLIYGFKKSRETLDVINTNDEFEKKLYSTYLSFLPENEFNYSLNTHIDSRGSFSEIIKTENKGQFSVNIAKPGIVKGNHWHNTKNEKFIVVKGEALISFRKPFSDSVIKYEVSDKKIEVVDIPCGYTHNIKNIGNEDLVFFIWCNECFDKENPDTYYLEV